MPFGLHGAAATFQRLMDQILAPHAEYAAAYMDDIVIYSQTWAQHKRALRAIFSELKHVGLMANPQKCVLAQKETKYLGFLVGRGMIRPLSDKVEIIQNFTAPQNCHQLWSFLGLTNYYRRFALDFSELATPLIEALKRWRTGIVRWTEEITQSFERLKQALCEDVIIHTPDFKKPFILQTDASETAVGAILTQKEGDTERPVAYASRKLLPAEERCKGEDQAEDLENQTKGLTSPPGSERRGETRTVKPPTQFISCTHIQLGPGDVSWRCHPAKTKGCPEGAGGVLVSGGSTGKPTPRGAQLLCWAARDGGGGAWGGTGSEASRGASSRAGGGAGSGANSSADSEAGREAGSRTGGGTSSGAGSRASREASSGASRGTSSGAGSRAASSTGRGASRGTSSSTSSGAGSSTGSGAGSSTGRGASRGIGSSISREASSGAGSSTGNEANGGRGSKAGYRTGDIDGQAGLSI
ncbi:probable GH family 25 lysozyme 3 [Alligator mississippiensis]|uniref:probable GH family 25 lysozyme 3 n=1 Tax=Alligator mississippiensis TaxID=8496 RepID=UPI0028776BB0|nr:probable GH family 25 lysozyme 3 [Alligator mississippiensis]